MEQSNPDNKNKPPTKRRFIPKAPPRRRVPKPEIKVEVTEEAPEVQAKDLLRRFNENTRIKSNVDRKATSAQVAFGYGGSSTSAKGWSGSFHKKNSSGGASGTGEEKEYKDPWDYYSNYPVTLPLRRPYSGNPELLNQEEFGESSETRTHHEDSTNSAVDLGLTEKILEPHIILLKLPPMLPMVKQSSHISGNEGAKSSASSSREKLRGLEELPAGCMGKLLVYRSGAVKLKLGDTLYDVSPGVKTEFSQDVVAVNTKEKHCSVVEEVNESAIVSLDVDSMLKSAIDRE